MKKALFTLILLVVLSCGNDDCSIDSALITEYSAQITVLKQKNAATDLPSEKLIYQTQINELENKITTEASRCD